MRKESYEAICNVIRNLNVEDAVEVFNEMCFRLNDSDRYIFEMESIDDMFGEFSIRKAFKLANKGNFNINDKYVYQSGKQRYLYSFNDVNDDNFKEVFDVIELADFIINAGDIKDVDDEQRFKDWLLNIFVTE